MLYDSRNQTRRDALNKKISLIITLIFIMTNILPNAALFAQNVDSLHGDQVSFFEANEESSFSDGESGDGDAGYDEASDSEPSDDVAGYDEASYSEPGDGDAGYDAASDSEPGDGEPSDGEPSDGEPSDGEDAYEVGEEDETDEDNTAAGLVVITGFDPFPYTDPNDPVKHYFTVDVGTAEHDLPLPMKLLASIEGDGGLSPSYPVSVAIWQCIGVIDACDGLTSGDYYPDTPGLYRFAPSLALEDDETLDSGIALPTVDVLVTAPVTRLGTRALPEGIYVGSSGSDEFGLGTRDQPYATLHKAVQEADEVDIIHLLDDVVFGKASSEIDTRTTITIYLKDITIQPADYGDNPDRRFTISRYDGVEPFTGNFFNIAYSTLTLNNIILDGKHVEGASPVVTVRDFSDFVMVHSDIVDNISLTPGSAVFLTSSSAGFHMTDGKISGNSTALGSDAIYVNAGLITLAGAPRIGLDDMDNGILLNEGYYVQIEGKLDTGAYILFERISNHRFDTVVARATDAATADEAAMLHWKSHSYRIAYRAGEYYLAEDDGSSKIYVAASGAPHNGDDLTGNGSRERPYASLAKAFAEAPISLGAPYNVNVYLMSDITLYQQATMRAYSQITLLRDPDATVSKVTLSRFEGDLPDRGPFVDNMIQTVRYAILVIGSEGGPDDVIFDGQLPPGAGISGTGSLIYIDQGEVTIHAGVLTNNTASGYGGGIYLTGAGAGGTLNMYGGVISGNRAVEPFGDDIFFFNGTLNLSGAPYIGTPSANGGVFISEGVATMTLTAPLSPEALIYIEARGTAADIDMPPGRNPAPKTPVAKTLGFDTTVEESRRFVWAGGGKLRVEKADTDQQTYWLDYSPDVYVASPGGLYEGDDIDGDGTQIWPYATVGRAVEHIRETSFPLSYAYIQVMDDVDMGLLSTIPGGREVTVLTWAETQAVLDDPAPLSRARVLRTQSSVAPVTPMFTVSPGARLTFDHIIIDGNQLYHSANTGSIVAATAGVAGASSVTLTHDALLRNNTATNGGAVSLTGYSQALQARLTLDQSVIRGNTAAGTTTAGGYGGGVYSANANATIEITGSEISGNTAAGTATVGSLGGGIYLNGGLLNITDSEISGNIANISGGGLYQQAGTTVAKDAVISGNSAGGKLPAEGGGGLYLAGGSLTLGGESRMTANTLTGTVSSLGTYLGGANGEAVHFAGGTFTLADKPVIGADRFDNGVYIGTTTGMISQPLPLDDDAYVVVELKREATADTNYNLVDRGAIDRANDDEARRYHYQYGIYLIRPSEDGRYYRLSSREDLYVAEWGFDDIRGFGTKEDPFLTIRRAFEVAATDLDVHVWVMTDLDQTLNPGAAAGQAQATVGAYKTITMQAYEHFPYYPPDYLPPIPAPADPDVPTVTRTHGDAIIYVAPRASLTIADMIFDGDRLGSHGSNTSPLIIVGTYANPGTNGLHLSANLTIREGTVLKNNLAADGGAISVRGSYHQWGTNPVNYASVRAQLTMEGGLIEDNIATGSGGGVSLVSQSNPTTLNRTDFAHMVMTGGLIQNNTAQGTTAAQGGGGVYSSGQFSMGGGSIIGNNLTHTAANGRGVHYATGSMTLSGAPFIGEDRDGNGVYIATASLTGSGVISQPTALTGGNIAIERKNGATANANYNIIDRGAAGIATPLDPELDIYYYQYQSGMLSLRAGADGRYYRVGAPSNIYVADGPMGNDNTGNGTRAFPFRTLWKAFDVAEVSLPTTVWLMTDLEHADPDNLTGSATAVVGANKVITLLPDGYQDDGSGSGPVFTVTRNRNAALISIAGNGSLTIADIVFDGDRLGVIHSDNTANASPLIIVGTTANPGQNGQHLSATLTIRERTTLKNNRADNGGAVSVRGGYHQWGANPVNYASVRAQLTMEGGLIENNVATGSGGGVYLDSNNVNYTHMVMTGGTIQDNEAQGTAANQGGGGVYSSGQFSMGGGSIVGNSLTSYVANDPGSPKGRGVYYAAGSMTLTGDPVIGASDGSGNGVYIATAANTGAGLISQPTALTGSSTIVIEGKNGATANQNFYIVSRGGQALTTPAELARYHYQQILYSLRESTDRQYYRLDVDREFYVSEAIGNDREGDGTVGKPFRTLWRAFDVTEAWNVAENVPVHTTVWVMTDLPHADPGNLPGSATATVAAYKDITLKPYELYPGTPGDPYPTVTRNHANGMISVAANGTLVIEDMVFDGNMGTSPWDANNTSLITSAGNLTIGKNVTLKNNHAGTANGGALHISGGALDMRGQALNNQAENGGGIYLAAGTAAAPLMLTAAVVSGNTATVSGGGVYQASGTAIAEDATITANTASGTAATQGGGGLYSVGAFTVRGSSGITGNSRTGTANGGDVYYAAGRLTLSDAPDIGTAAAGDGIYIATASNTGAGLISQPTALTGGHVVVERKDGATASLNFNIVDRGGIDRTSAAEMATYRYLEIPYSLRESDDRQYYRLHVERDFYVSETIGDDRNPGTESEPFRTLWRAFDVAEAVMAGATPYETRVWVMTDLPHADPGNLSGSATAAVAANKDIVVKPYAGYDPGSDGAGIYPTVTRNHANVLIRVAAGGVLEIQDMVFDGDRVNNSTNASPLIESGGRLTLGENVTLENNRAGTGATHLGGAVNITGGIFDLSGTVRDNRAGYGGGLYIGGAGTVVNLTGATIVDNTAEISGGGFYMAAGTVAATGAKILRNRAAGEGITNGGGGVYMAGGVFTVTDGEMKANRLENVSHPGTHTGGANGRAVYFGSGTFALRGTPVIGEDIDDNGIYIATASNSGAGLIRQPDALGAGANVVIELKNSASSIANYNLVDRGDSYLATTTEAEQYQYQDRAYYIYPSSDGRYYRLGYVPGADLYVADAPLGDDLLGDGTVDHPFRTLWRAFRLPETVNPTNVIVMTDLPHAELTDSPLSYTAVVDENRDITLRGWDQYAGPGGIPTVYRNHSDIMIEVRDVYMTTMSPRLTIMDLIIDGKQDVAPYDTNTTPLIVVGSRNDNRPPNAGLGDSKPYQYNVTSTSSLTVGAGAVLRNNRATDGGAVWARSVRVSWTYSGSPYGTWYRTVIAEVKVDGGLIEGNTAVGSGGGLCLTGGYANMIMTEGEISDNTAEGAAATQGGGGVYLNGSFTMYGGIITGNHLTNSAKRGTGTGLANGHGVYYAAGSLTLSGEPVIGKDINDDGVYIATAANTGAGVMTQSGPLEGDARIFIEQKSGATQRVNYNLVDLGAAGKATEDEAGRYRYQYERAWIVRPDDAGRYYRLGMRRDIYVADAPLGDDRLGDGSPEEPFRTLWRAFSLAEDARPTNVIVMTDLPHAELTDSPLSYTAVVDENKDITLRGWEGYKDSSGATGDVPTLYRNNSAILIEVRDVYMTTLSPRLTIVDLIIDGQQDVAPYDTNTTPLIVVGSRNDNRPPNAGLGDSKPYQYDVTSTSSLTVGAGAVLRNNRATDGGAVWARSVRVSWTYSGSPYGTWYRTVIAEVKVDGGRIEGNTAVGSGGGLCLTGGYANMTMTGGEISDNTAEGAAATQGGGGVYLNGAFTMYGGIITGNHLTNSAKRGVGTGLANGHGVYYAAGSLTLSGEPVIGKDIDDDGVYIATAANTGAGVMTQSGPLEGDARIFIEQKSGATQRVNYNLVDLGAAGKATEDEARRYRYQYERAWIVRPDDAGRYYRLGMRRDIYVADAPLGDDRLGDGSPEKPFRTLWRAFSLAEDARPTNVIVMTDLPHAALTDSPLSYTAVVDENKDITLRGWDQYAGPGGIPTVYRNHSDIMIEVRDVYMTTMSPRLTIVDLIIDGKQDVAPYDTNTTPLIVVGSRNDNRPPNAGLGGSKPYQYDVTSTSSLTVGAGAVLRNNRATDGGAVWARSVRVSWVYSGSPYGTWYRTVRAEVKMDGGRIEGNTAVGSGGGLCLTGGYATMTMTEGEISDNTAEGAAATQGGGGVYLNGAFTMRGGIITGNHLTNSAKRGTGTGLANGHGVYYAAGSLTLSGEPVIGKDINDDGVYIATAANTGAGVMTQSGPLEGDARIFVEQKSGATQRVNYNLVDLGAVGKATEDEAGRYRYQYEPAWIVRPDDAGRYYRLGMRRDIYVADAPLGDDRLGDGTPEEPFRTLWRAFSLAEDARPTNVIVMTDLPHAELTDSPLSYTAVVDENKDITLRGWDQYAGPGGIPTVYRNNDNIMIEVRDVYMTTMSPRLTIVDLIIDGQQDIAPYDTNTTPLIVVGSRNDNRPPNAGLGGSKPYQYDVTSTSSLTVGAGAVLRNNRATDGGAVWARSVRVSWVYSGSPYGTWYRTVRAEVKMDGGLIEGNTAVGSGGGLCLTGGYATMTMTGGEISDNTAEGTAATQGGGGVYSAGTFHMSGGLLTDNRLAYATANGPAVFFGGGVLQLSGEPKVGKDDDDNGIWISAAAATITQSGDLGSGAYINIAGKTGAQSGTLLVTKTGSATSDAEALHYYWQHGYVVARNRANTNTYYLTSPADIYVASEDGAFSGDDVTGRGTIARPFATIGRAFGLTGPATSVPLTTIHIMDDLEQDALAALTTGSFGGKNVMLRAWRDPDGIHAPAYIAPTGEVKVTRASGFTNNYMISILGTNTLSIRDLTIDGGGSAAATAGPGYAAIFVSGDINNANATLNLENDSRVVNNHNAGTTGNGGGVYVLGGGTSGTINAILNVTGGEISGNTAQNGGGVYLQSTAATRRAVLNLSGVGQIADNEATGSGTYQGGGGVYQAANSVLRMTGGAIRGNRAGGAVLTNGGGGIYLAATAQDALTMIGGLLTGNTVGPDDSPGNMSVGRAVYAISGTWPVVGERIRVGEDPRDNGIYLLGNATLVQRTHLNAYARVNVEGKQNHAPGMDISYKSIRDTGEAEAKLYRYQQYLYYIDVRNEYYYELRSTRDFYVATQDGPYKGSDRTGDGSIDYPFATVHRAMEAVTPGVPSFIHVMEDLVLCDGTSYPEIPQTPSSRDVPVEIPDGKDVTIQTWEGAGDKAVLTRHDGYPGALFMVQAGGTLTIKDLIVDGNKANVTADGPIVRIVGGNAKDATFTLEDGGVLRNNANTGDGGAVFITGELRYEGSIEFRTGVAILEDGSEISGNTAGRDGGGVYIGKDSWLIVRSGLIIGNEAGAGAVTDRFGHGVYYGDGLMTIIGRPVIGKDDTDNGVYLAIPTGVASLAHSIKQVGDLLAGSNINIEDKKDRAAYDLIAEKSGGTSVSGFLVSFAESNFYRWTAGGDLRLVPGGSQEYRLASAIDLYVANPDTAKNNGVPAGSDVTGKGTVEEPFATVEYAFWFADPGKYVNVFVMDNGVVFNSTAIVDPGKNITLQKWPLALETEIKVTRGIGHSGILIDVASPPEGHGIPGAFVLRDVSISGGDLPGTVSNPGNDPAVRIRDGAQMLMMGGAIEANIAKPDLPAGVSIEEGSSLLMLGGAIQGNRSDTAAVEIGEDATFYMANASVTLNDIGTGGGAVLVAESGARLEMRSGAAVTVNIGAGYGVRFTEGTFSIAGDARVDSNLSGHGVYLGADSEITVDGDLQTGAFIEVTGKAGAQRGTIIARKVGGAPVNRAESRLFFWEPLGYTITQDTLLADDTRHDNTYILYDEATAYISATQGGGEPYTKTSTELILRFDKLVPGLAAENISLSPARTRDYSIVRGALQYLGTEGGEHLYEVKISGNWQESDEVDATVVVPGVFIEPETRRALLHRDERLATVTANWILISLRGARTIAFTEERTGLLGAEDSFAYDRSIPYNPDLHFPGPDWIFNEVMSDSGRFLYSDGVTINFFFDERFNSAEMTKETWDVAAGAWDGDAESIIVEDLADLIRYRIGFTVTTNMARAETLEIQDILPPGLIPADEITPENCVRVYCDHSGTHVLVTALGALELKDVGGVSVISFTFDTATIPLNDHVGHRVYMEVDLVIDESMDPLPSSVVNRGRLVIDGDGDTEPGEETETPPQAILYAVIFDAATNGGTIQGNASETQYVWLGGTTEDPGRPEHTNPDYVFLGWFTAPPDGTYTFTGPFPNYTDAYPADPPGYELMDLLDYLWVSGPGGTPVAGPTTVYAVWGDKAFLDIKEITVSYRYRGYVEEEAPLLPPDVYEAVVGFPFTAVAPEIDHYSFNEWFLDGTFQGTGNRNISIAAVTDDHDIVLIYDMNTRVHLTWRDESGDFLRDRNGVILMPDALVEVNPADGYFTEPGGDVRGYLYIGYKVSPDDITDGWHAYTPGDPAATDPDLTLAAGADLYVAYIYEISDVHVITIRYRDRHGNTIRAQDTDEVYDGETFTWTAPSIYEYVFVDWQKDGGALMGNRTVRIDNVTGPHTVTLVYGQDKGGGGGDGEDPDGEEDVTVYRNWKTSTGRDLDPPRAQEVIYVNLPGPYTGAGGAMSGYRYLGYKASGAAITGGWGTYSTAPVSEALTAGFDLYITYVYELTAEDRHIVTIEYQNHAGATLRASDTDYVRTGGTFTWTAPGISGYVFAGWRLDGGALIGDAAILVAGVDSDHVVTLVYGPRGTQPPDPPDPPDPPGPPDPPDPPNPPDPPDPPGPPTPPDPPNPPQPPGGIDPEIPPTPTPTDPGHTLAPGPDPYTWIELDENGTPVGEWHWNGEEWIFEAYPPPLDALLPKTGEPPHPWRGILGALAVMLSLLACAHVVLTKKEGDKGAYPYH